MTELGTKEHHSLLAGMRSHAAGGLTCQMDREKHAMHVVTGWG